jgi:hypothetical protein
MAQGDGESSARSCRRILRALSNSTVGKDVSAMIATLGKPIKLDQRIMRTIAMVGLAMPLFWFLLFSDRGNVIDQENYLNYFEVAGSGYWQELFSDVALDNPLSWLRIFTEEIVWWWWVELLSFLPPEVAVRLTTVAISGMLFVSAFRLRVPVLAWVLWIVLPYTFSVVGYYQIRQGFAFATFIFLGVVFRKYFLGLLIASAIHTTFTVPMLFWGAAKLWRHANLKTLSVVFLSIIIPLVLGVFFDQVAGRRGEQYQIAEGVTSINFAVSMLLMASLPAVLIRFNNLRQQLISVLPLEYLVTYLAALLFLFVSFFMFPIGTARVGYFSGLMAVPLLASINYSGLLVKRPAHYFLLLSLVITYAFWFYQIVVIAKAGFYFCLNVSCV